ncbi:class I SAM-dependent rRNA methyltransferase [Halobacteriovorax sp. HLS]|uniref:class I SAM-dependent rRNA methyltransferase n=1 Tax=Halobacteriovorax sp. HLS TaxID=2234000 RepID=UPI000FD9D2AA|nr:class I SAM-dependent methyltransferase [Halobacteriovorax sp. HLS]
MVKKHKLPRVALHPATIKHAKKGHPWVTADSFTKDFPKKENLLIGKDPKSDDRIFLLHDPTHKKVKARIWEIGKEMPESPNGFIRSFATRLEDSILKRTKVQEKLNRDNFYLAFAEADGIPGLMIQKFNNIVLVQIYCDFWYYFKNDIRRIIKKLCAQYFPEVDKTIFQQRKEADSVKFSDLENKVNEITIKEFGINYHLKFDYRYDIGIYSDMSSIRKKLTNEIRGSKRVLNLYSYTGAFSLFSLSLKAEHVTSVDLSKDYIDWLERNLALNPQLDASKHTSKISSVEKALKDFSIAGEKFDLIICDPPSFSSDGKRSQNSLKSYDKLIPLMSACLSDSGKIVAFINTHQTSRKKFNEKIGELAGKEKLSIEKQLKMDEDCKTLGGFAEGDYLKGVVLKRI